MTTETSRTIVVTGATGLQGGAVARALLEQGWRVRALTRDPQSEKAQALKALGAEVVQADMADPASLRAAFAGAQGVFSVQNPILSGTEGEVTQGKNVADTAREVGVQHVVYSSAGPEARGTGVPSWESKRVIADYLLGLGLPLTILRPMAFMEIMTEKKFYPQMSTWQVMPKLMGGGRPVGWISAADLGRIAAKAFGAPERFSGREIPLASDVQSIDEARAIYREVTGKPPRRFPIPPAFFRRFGFVGQDLTAMWNWLRENTIDLDTHPTLELLPDALNVRSFLERATRPGG